MTELSDLTDEELGAFIRRWRASGEEYRRLRSQVDASHPNAYRWGYSGWRCSTYESEGLREIARRESEENT